MSLKRKLFDELVLWKNERNGKSAVLIEGARRVGKSFIVLEFAKKMYKSFIFIDFNNTPQEIKDLFLNSISDFDQFFSKLSFFSQTLLYERDSLIILDEIQKCPEAREKIKYFVEYGKYDFIETGSLLSIKENVKDITIPSEETTLYMRPLDFEEFLWANGEEIIIPMIKEHYSKLIPLDNGIHNKLMLLFREYMLVGGMPQAVNEFIKSKDFYKVDIIKREILKLYENDISKHSNKLKTTIAKIFNNIPEQLSKHEKKFKYSSIGKLGRYRKYEDSFFWLEDSMITNCCYNTTEPNYGLRMSIKNSSLKLYMGDTGLLVTHTFSNYKPMENIIYKNILFDKLQINEGMIVENVVAQMLKAIGYRLYFFSNKLKTGDQKNTEIDFLIQRDSKISPIEVKSSSSNRHRSLDKFSLKFKTKIGYRYIITKNNLKVDDDCIFIPFYMVFCL